MTRTIRRKKQMTITPYNFDLALDDFFSRGITSGRQSTNSKYVQTSNENAYTIEAPMVGVTKQDLTVNVEGNRLIVRANASVKSRFSNNFHQEWILNEDADVSAINAHLSNGILLLTIPRVKPAVRSVNVTIQ